MDSPGIRYTKAYESNKYSWTVNPSDRIWPPNKFVSLQTWYMHECALHCFFSSTFITRTEANRVAFLSENLDKRQEAGLRGEG